jgi:hypothetical protein
MPSLEHEAISRIAIRQTIFLAFILPLLLDILLQIYEEKPQILVFSCFKVFYETR